MSECDAVFVGESLTAHAEGGTKCKRCFKVGKDCVRVAATNWPAVMDVYRSIDNANRTAAIVREAEIAGYKVTRQMIRERDDAMAKAHADQATVQTALKRYRRSNAAEIKRELGASGNSTDEESLGDIKATVDELDENLNEVSDAIGHCDEKIDRIESSIESLEAGLLVITKDVSGTHNQLQSVAVDLAVSLFPVAA